MSSLRDRILAADDLTSESVEVPEWGVTVEVRSPTAAQRGTLLRETAEGDGTLNLEVLYPRLVILTATDPETGEPLFTNDDFDALCGKSGKAVERVAQAAMRVAGLADGAVEEGKGDS